MQIFYSDPSFIQCAIDLDDSRLRKQILEFAQICSTTLWIENCDIAETLYAQGKIYLPCHEHHPIVKNCKYNFYTCLKFAFICYNEHLYRKGNVHKSVAVLKNLLDYVYLFDKYEHKEFQNNTTNHKHIKNLHEAYKKELILKWNNDKLLPVWTKRNKPIFYKEI